jgi:hypothetical protein
LSKIQERISCVGIDVYVSGLKNSIFSDRVDAEISLLEDEGKQTENEKL